MLEHYLDLVSCLYFIILLDDGTIDPYMAFFGSLLDFVPRSVLNKVHQEFIHAQWFLTF